MSKTRASIRVLFLLLSSFLFADEDPFWIEVPAQNSYDRTAIADLGFAIDIVKQDRVLIAGTSQDLKKLKSKGYQAKRSSSFLIQTAFPRGEDAYHDYAETISVLDGLQRDFPDIVQRVSLGKSTEGREIGGVRLSSIVRNDSRATIVFMGCHHAREHLSVEIPLMLADYLAHNYDKNARIKELLDTREVWIVPMVNPDGAEYDLGSTSYRMWRKNRKRNQDGTYGVDLNRNYGGIGFGGSGSSGRTSDETYRGASAFSEIETQRVRDFVLKRTKTKVLITYHTFSKLILWPWGHTYNQIPNTTDRRVFETMGNEMSKWTGYKAEKASDLYLASGDTTDWAYGEKGIFAFTFELDPGTNQQGGFYPGVGAIQTTFSKNIEPALYAIDMGIDPYSVLPTMNSLTQNLVDTLLPRFSIK